MRIILALVVHFGWSLRQLDVSNSFLHGVLQEVYMSQPPRCKDHSKPYHVCMLHKAIYGLKQAPRSWFDSFTTQLFHLGFHASCADSNLFILIHSYHIFYLLLYVDDIIITGNHSTFVAEFIKKLGVSFALKDLGHLSYFLGLQIEYTSDGIFVHQSKYAKDLLAKFHMLDSKPCSNPCASNHSHVPSASPLLPDPTAYRSFVGALQYLTFTRPDLSYAVQQACQFMCKPSQHHLIATKRILRYLRGTLHLGIYFTSGPLNLSTYCDSDWAGNPIDRRSITGMVVFLGNSPITWFAKKQSVVSRSSIEAEYRSLAITTAELYWLRMLLKDLGNYLYHPPILWCDNVSVLALASNPIFMQELNILKLTIILFERKF
nr:uncharacterized protein LOC112027122 [Quercus suber]